MLDEEIGQAAQNRIAVELLANGNGQALQGVLVDHGEHPEGLSVMDRPLNEAIGSDIIGTTGPQTDAGAIGEPQSPALRLLLWHLQPLASPDPLDPFVVHEPAFNAQQRCHPTKAVTAVLSCPADARRRQRFLVILNDRAVALARSGLTQHRAGPTFRDRITFHHVRHAAAATLGAYQFPSATSFRISLSEVRSATARLSRVFSCSFRRCAWSIFRPQYSRRQR